jgi:hypothetical protein
MKSYIGYVVGKEETNPISVWIPAKGGYGKYGANRGFGSNAGNMTLLDLAFMRTNAEKCYLSSEMNAGGSYNFDDSNGFVTLEDNISGIDETTVKDVKNMDSSKVAVRHSAPGDGEFLQSPHTRPAANWLQTYYPQQVEGAEINVYSNAPKGTFTTLPIGTKVMVSYPDEKGIGYIIRQIPYDDEMSKVIKNVTDN